MSRLKWDEREYEVGVDRGVFYPVDGDGEVWNGLVSVAETPTDLYQRVRYFDGKKIVDRRRDDSFSATISAFSHPLSFLQNPRKPFGLSYRIQTAKSYKIHLVYNAVAHISGRTFDQSDDLQAQTVDVTTSPLWVAGIAPTAHIFVDASVAWPSAVSSLEDILYGSDEESPRLPDPNEVLAIFEANAIVRVINNDDGSATITGPDNAVTMIDAVTGRITWPSVIFVGEDTYTISTL